MDSGKFKEEDDQSVRLQVIELHKLNGANGSKNNAIFEPRNSIQKTDSGDTGDVVSDPSATIQTIVPAPEKKLTLFALRLAILEKAATGLGTLGFIWATVVLLGGFAITLDKTDFWFITIILLIEGARIFSRSHELEWQHQTTWTITGVGISSFQALRSSSLSLVHHVKGFFKRIRNIRSVDEMEDQVGRRRGPLDRRPTRIWNSSDVPILPYGKWFFISSNVSRLLYWLQLLSAATCVALSSYKLIKHNYGNVQKGDTDKRNRRSALNIFYALALAEALLFLAEKVYWEWQVSYHNLLEKVTRECELGVTGLVSIRRFFYDAYSKCIDGSIFDGLKMDMVSFAMELLDSSSFDEQLIGVRILRQFATNEHYSEDTMQKIGVNLTAIERFVEMLNWKDSHEEEIRRSAAEILAKLAGKKQNSLRVTGISGAMESISSLLENTRSLSTGPDEIAEKRISHHHHHLRYDFWRFNNLGLLILKKLARDHDNCGKIGNTRGLLPKIIDFTHMEDQKVLKEEDATQSQILTVKRSLQLVKMLASTTGITGKCLRREISEIVFTISNIRDILRYGGRYPKLQKLGIEILSYLALEVDATEKIGATGGILKELFNIFFKKEMPEKQSDVRLAAGEAIAMLALESQSNCRRILKLRVLERLVEALEVPLLRVNSARILRNLCIYSGEECFHDLKHIKAAAPTVVKAIMSAGNKLQEVMVGLAAQMFRFMSSKESSLVFTNAGIKTHELAGILVHILKEYDKPAMKVPRIRRFVIELAISMMENDPENIKIFRDLGMEKELESVLETTAELENFDIFSGTVGLSRHSNTVHSLADSAMRMLEDGQS